MTLGPPISAPWLLGNSTDPGCSCGADQPWPDRLGDVTEGALCAGEALPCAGAPLPPGDGLFGVQDSYLCD